MVKVKKLSLCVLFVMCFLPGFASENAFVGQGEQFMQYVGDKTYDQAYGMLSEIFQEAVTRKTFSEYFDFRSWVDWKGFT